MVVVFKDENVNVGAILLKLVCAWEPEMNRVSLVIYNLPALIMVSMVKSAGGHHRIGERS